MRRLFVTGDSNITALRGAIDYKLSNYSCKPQIFYLPTNPFIQSESKFGINVIDEYFSKGFGDFTFVFDEKHPHLQKLYELYYTQTLISKLMSDPPNKEDIVVCVGREFGAGARLLGRYGPLVMNRMPERVLTEQEKRFEGLKFLPTYPDLPLITQHDNVDYPESLISRFGLMTSRLANELYENLASTLMKKIARYKPKLFLIEAPPPSERVARLFWGDEYVIGKHFISHLEVFRSAFVKIFSNPLSSGEVVKLYFGDIGHFGKFGFIRDEFSLDPPDLHAKPVYFSHAVSDIFKNI